MRYGSLNSGDRPHATGLLDGTLEEAQATQGAWREDEHGTTKHGETQRLGAKSRSWVRQSAARGRPRSERGRPLRTAARGAVARSERARRARAERTDGTFPKGLPEGT